jgi:Pentapeptide repeats (8 copies)
MSDSQQALTGRPVSWNQLREKRYYWFVTPRWVYSWLVFWSQSWSFLRILDAAGKFVIVFAIAQWFLEAGDRAKERHYKAWDIVNTARGSTGDGGRRDALQDLNNDGVSLADAPLSKAYLIGVKLPGATLNGATLSDTNLVEASLANANLSLADLTGANLAGAKLNGANLGSAKLIDANLIGANLAGTKLGLADLTGANLLGASLFGADLAGATTDGAMFCRTLMPDGSTNNGSCAGASEPSASK